MSAESHFLFVSEEASLGMMVLEAFQVQDDGRGSERVNVVVLSKNHTFLIGVSCFLRMVGDAGDTRAFIARIRPALPGLPVLISGFHLRTCHRSTGIFNVIFCKVISTQTRSHQRYNQDFYIIW